jgi:hypothetical protein
LVCISFLVRRPSPYLLFLGVKMEDAYELIWRNKFLTSEAQSIDDMIECLRTAVDDLVEMRSAGIVLDPDSEIGEDYARLITSDARIAAKYGMEQEMDLEEEFEEEEEED